LISTLLRDKNNGGKLTEKTASIVIKIQKGDKSRSVGMINVNLADYIDENMSKIQKLPIEKCPDKSASLEFKIKCCLISEIQGSENMSSMSGFNDLDVDSDPETEFRFENID
jgi:excinuclease UvrABC nuclease subunit